LPKNYPRVGKTLAVDPRVGEKNTLSGWRQAEEILDDDDDA